MHQKRIITSITLTLLAVMSLAPLAYAREGEEAATGGDDNKGALVSPRTENEGMERGSSDDRAAGNATSAAAKEREGQEQGESTEASEASENDDKGLGEEHKSETAKFVRTLLDIADRDGGIGQDVREIAREQASSSEKVSNAIGEVENRGAVKTFFFGPDYKNLGMIRSEMVQTRDRIEQLNREMERAASSTDTTAVRAEIANMEKVQTRLNDYVQANESKFSLFGWFAKWFQ